MATKNIYCKFCYSVIVHDHRGWQNGNYASELGPYFCRDISMEVQPHTPED